MASLGPNDVRIKVLASPINPADLNFVEGIYGHKPASFPAVPGGEGVAKVIEVGPNVTSLAVDDHVIPAGTGFGKRKNDGFELISSLKPRNINRFLAH